MTMRALLKPGDEIVVQMPSYQSLFAVAGEIGCHITEYRLKFEEQWDIDLNKLRKTVTSRTKMLILNYPHNPTGACLTDAEMAEIVRICDERGVYLIADEAYRFLRQDARVSDASFADLYDRAVVLGSFSKTFASPGLRLGWVASRNQGMLERILEYRHFTSTCTNLPCQWIASELLEKRDAIIRRNNEIVRKNAALLEGFVKKYAELFAYVPPKGATMAYVKLLNGQSAMEFCMEILEYTGVLLVPSSVLEDSDEYLRVGLCRESFPECVRIIDTYLSEVD